eukprot:scpid38851/ scgid18103/ 
MKLANPGRKIKIGTNPKGTEQLRVDSRAWDKNAAAEMLRFEHMHHTGNKAPAYGTLGELATALDAATHVATFEKDTVDALIHADATFTVTTINRRRTFHKGACFTVVRRLAWQRVLLKP